MPTEDPIGISRCPQRIAKLHGDTHVLYNTVRTVFLSHSQLPYSQLPNWKTSSTVAIFLTVKTTAHLLSKQSNPRHRPRRGLLVPVRDRGAFSHLLLLLHLERRLARGSGGGFLGRDWGQRQGPRRLGACLLTGKIEQGGGRAKQRMV